MRNLILTLVIGLVTLTSCKKDELNVNEYEGELFEVRQYDASLFTGGWKTDQRMNGM